MSDLQEALFFLDLDKGAMTQGPLFESAAERLASEPTLRSGWAQFQALRALAWETAPQPAERAFKQVLQQCKRDHVGKRLAQAAGSDELARELLLGKVSRSSGLPAWVWALLLTGALGLGWLSFQNGALPFQSAHTGAAPVPTAVTSAAADEPMAFEFNPQSATAEAALAQPLTDTADGEMVAGEPLAARQARQLLNEHLRQAEDPERPVVKAAPKAAVHVKKPKPAPPTRVPSPTATSSATPRPSATPTKASTPTAMATPTAWLQSVPAIQATDPVQPAPLIQATAQVQSAPLLQVTAVPLPSTPPAAAALTAAPPLPATVLQQASPVTPPATASMSLSASILSVSSPITVTLQAPEAGAADLRLFDQSGRSVRRLAEGPVAAGERRYLVDALNDAGAALPAGTYYLRVMTPWFSRVEAIQVP